MTYSFICLSTFHFQDCIKLSLILFICLFILHNHTITIIYRLSEKLIYNENISPVCLPTISMATSIYNQNHLITTSSSMMNGQPNYHHHDLDDLMNEMNIPSSSSSTTTSINNVDDDDDVDQNLKLSHRRGYRAAAVSPSLIPSSSSSSLDHHHHHSTGIVVGWGSVERHGDLSGTGSSATMDQSTQSHHHTLADDFVEQWNRMRNNNTGHTNNNNNMYIDNDNDGRWTIMNPVLDSDDLLQLRKVELPFIDRFTCERWYASRSRPIQLIERQFCAGLYEGGKDACRVSVFY